MKFEKVQYLTVQDVAHIHLSVLVDEEDPGILKPNELDAAVLAVQATFGGAPLLGSLAEVAAAYIFYLNRSHVFMDGNKRTSVFGALTFLELNGISLSHVPDKQLFEAVHAVVRHHMSQADLTFLLAQLMGNPEEIEW